MRSRMRKRRNRGTLGDRVRFLFYTELCLIATTYVCALAEPGRILCLLYVTLDCV